MRGRKPKPTALKQAEGNPGKRKLNAHEPGFAAQVPSCPRHLGPDARKEWRRMARVLTRTNKQLLTEAGRTALAIYCEEYQTWKRATELISKFDKVLTLPNGTKIELSGDVIVTQHGNVIQNPYRSIANRSAEIMLKVMGEFGMTPSSASRIDLGDGEPPPDSLRALLAARRDRRVEEEDSAASTVH
jgi:P27 family predicted phage terminase small subunit